MSLIRKQTLIGLCCASVILDLNESTIRQKAAGTENLTLVRRGNGKRQRISLILEEVIALKSEWIEEAQRKQAKVYSRQSTKKLVLVG